MQNWLYECNLAHGSGRILQHTNQTIVLFNKHIYYSYENVLVIVEQRRPTLNAKEPNI